MIRRFLRAGAIASALCLPFSASADVNLLTSIKPLQLIAAAIQQGAGTPDVLLPPGASAHHYSLRPSDVRRLHEAQLFYWIGPDLEGFLADSLSKSDGSQVAVQRLEGLNLRYFDAGESGDEHDHDHHERHDDAHRAGSIDAHLWLAPANARVIARQISADLSRLDPSNAARYRSNLSEFEARLTQLDHALKVQLTHVGQRPYFVFHDAYGYFEQAYGLRHTGVFNISTEVQPGVRHVAALRDSLQSAGPSCVFSEPPLRPRLVDTLTDGLPVKMDILDPLGADIAPSATGYETLLHKLATTLSACLTSLQQ